MMNVVYLTHSPHFMQRANQFRVKPSKANTEILKEIMEHTAYLYNTANYEKRLETQPFIYAWEGSRWR